MALSDNLRAIPESNRDNMNPTEVANFKTWFESTQDAMTFNEFKCWVDFLGLDLNRFIPYGQPTFGFVPEGGGMLNIHARPLILGFANPERRDIGEERNFGSACGGTNPAGYWRCKATNDKTWQEMMFESCGAYPAGYTPPNNNNSSGSGGSGSNANTENPIYKNPLLWLIVIVILIIAIGKAIQNS